MIKNIIRVSISLFIILLGLQTCYCQNSKDTKITLNEENIVFDPLEFRKLKLQVQKLSEEGKNLSTQIESLKKSSEQSERIVDSLNLQIQQLNDKTLSSLNQIEGRLTNTSESTEKRFTILDQSISRNTLYWLIAFLATALMSALAYVFLSKRQRDDKNDLIGQLTQAKSSIEENLVKEYSKQTDLMESQLELAKQQLSKETISSELTKDHSLALKVADEVTLIERNLSFMDSNTKGLKQLSASVRKLKDNLAANGYEIPELLGKKLNEGMKLVVANIIEDDNLEKGVEIISKIIKPQVNYENKMIQQAQIEISSGCK
jgi:hypothetical protein